jgi:hypothetical protein
MEQSDFQVVVSRAESEVACVPDILTVPWVANIRWNDSLFGTPIDASLSAYTRRGAIKKARARVRYIMNAEHERAVQIEETRATESTISPYSSRTAKLIRRSAANMKLFSRQERTRRQREGHR